MLQPWGNRATKEPPCGLDRSANLGHPGPKDHPAMSDRAVCGCRFPETYQVEEVSDRPHRGVASVRLGRRRKRHVTRRLSPTNCPTCDYWIVDQPRWPTRPQSKIPPAAATAAVDQELPSRPIWSLHYRLRIHRLRRPTGAPPNFGARCRFSRRALLETRFGAHLLLGRDVGLAQRALAKSGRLRLGLIWLSAS